MIEGETYFIDVYLDSDGNVSRIRITNSVVAPVARREAILTSGMIEALGKLPFVEISLNEGGRL